MTKIELLPKTTFRLFVFIFSLSSVALAQNGKQKVKYYDYEWESISKKYATYYRISEVRNDTLFASDYEMNGKLVKVGTYIGKKYSMKNGRFRILKEEVWSEGYYINDKREGKWIYKKGDSLYQVGSFKHDSMDGRWLFYHTNGVLSKDVFFVMDSVVKANEFKDTGEPFNEEDTFSFPDEAPSMGVTNKLALYDYLGARLKYPQQARNERIEGKVVVTFIIDKNGVVSNFKIRESNKWFDKEVLEILRTMPAWKKPAKSNGKIVCCRMSLPIQFKIN